MKNFYAKLFIGFLFFLGTMGANAQVTVTNPSNTTPGLAATYATLDAAITDLNLQTAISGPVTITLDASNPQTTPAGGYSITAILAGASATNTLTIAGSGNTITAFTPQTAGLFNDAFFKIIGGDFITISGFTMVENAANTTTAAVTNNMTEWGVALLYASATNGAQNNIIQNNTISLNRTYQNTFGVYSNSTHTATLVSTTVSATTAAGGNSGLKVYGNNISNVNLGIVVVGPTAAADANTGIDIGGSTSGTGNTITNFGTTGTFSSYVNVSGTVYGILVRNSIGFNISYNSITSSNGGIGLASTLRGVFIPAFSNPPTGTFTNVINNNTIALTHGFTSGTIQGITVENTTGNATSTQNINNNNFTALGSTVTTSGVITAISNAMSNLVNTINGNTFTNITSNTTGNFIFVNNNITVPSGGTRSISNNSIVTAFNKTGAGGTVTFFSTTASSTATVTSTFNSNNLSNITLTGATAFTGLAVQDGVSAGGPVTSIQNNVFNNITTGAGAVNVMFSGWQSAGSITTANTITNITSAGTLIIALGVTGSTGTTVNVYGNTISNVSSTGAATVVGIDLASGNLTNLYRNKIYDLTANNAAGIVSGIRISGGVSNNVYNNIIGGLSAPISTSSDAIRGINITSTAATSTNNVYFNTVYLGGSGGLNFGSSGIFHTASATATTAVLNLRNNVIVNNSTPNGTGLAVAYRRSSGIASTLSNYAATSNNNLFYAGTPGASNLIYSDGTSSAQTMSEYKAGVFTAGTIASRDASSVSENPIFLSLVGANANYLHIDPTVPTQIESGAGAIAGITDDYDGDVRNVSTPDIGADEGTFTLADFTAPSISYTPLPFTCGFGDRTLIASITDASGVPTSGAGLPVLYWRINAGAYTVATGVFVSGSNYSFTFGAGVALGDVVSYYIVAQDNAGTANVGAFPSAGAAGFASNPPSASTAPTSPSTYSINNILNGTYTVGATGTYTTLTAAIAAYNNTCLGGPVVFSLIDAAYTTTSDTIRVNADASATNTLTIKPTLAGTTITGNTTAAAIVFLGADYVTIDGSISNTANTVCPASAASRDLSIINSNASAASAVIWLRANGTDGANNNTIKNCNITGSGSAATILGIGSGGAGIGGAATTAVSNNNSIVNNNISRVQIGIYSAGINAASKNNGTVISQNLINSASPNNVSRGGIAAFSENNISVTGNNVSGMALTSTADAFGITLGSLNITTSATTGIECTNAVISKNIIGSVRHTATYSAYGILLAPGSSGTSEISNNMVSGVSSNGTDGDFGVGIFVLPLDGSTTRVYHNTVSMSGTQTGGNDKSYALAIAGGTTPTVDIKNNILVNKQNNGSGLNYAIGFGYTVFTNISTDNNGLFTSSGALYSLGATSSISAPVNQLTLTAWQTATSKDANSKNEEATFVSATDLHLVTPDAINFNNFESTGAVVSVTDDIDCETRPNGTAPDMGADEFVGALPACPGPGTPVISSITPSSAVATWTGSGTYILEYGPTGYTPGTGETAGVGGTLINPAVSPQSITGLSETTTYDLYVRTVCPRSVWSANSSVQTFTTLTPAPANDDCSNATVIPCDGSVSGNTGGANDDVLPGITCGSTLSTRGNNKSVWFSITPANSGSMTISTCTGTTFDTYMRVYTGDCGNFTTCVGFDDDGCAESTIGLSSFTFTAVGGTTYYVLLGGYGASDFGAYTISATCPAACATPTTPTMSAVTSTTATATWAGAGTYVLEYGLAGFTPGTGATAGVGGTVINPAVSPQSITGLSASTAYDLYVRLSCAGSTWSSNSAIRTFTTLAPPPANDECAAATTINTVSIAATTAGSTQTVSPESCAGFTASTANDVWFQFIASSNGTATVNVTNVVGFDPVIQVYSGTCGSLTNIGCADATTSGGSEVAALTGLVAGQTYYVRVYGYTSSTGTFDISVTGAALPISIEYFKGSKQSNGNLLDWKVSCLNSPTVTLLLERSADGRNFKTINTQSATASRCLQPFSFTDASPMAGINYYRLKTIDIDGKINYSTIVALLNKDKGFEIVSIMPNPVATKAMLSISSAQKSTMEIIITDLAGKQLNKQRVVLIAGSNQVPLNLINLAAGTYQVTGITDQGERKSVRFVKQ